MQPLISFQNIGKSFSSQKILNDLSLDIYHNEIFGLVGKSGSGKSTLYRILMGFYKPDNGTLIFDGKDITHDTHAIRQLIGLTTQENSFYPQLTVAENLRYYGRMYHLSHSDIDQRIPQLLQLVELTGHEKSFASELSGGMQRRLDFAISLIHDPPILLLDEPTTGLDPMLRKNLWQLIHNIRNFGKTIIITTHFFDELEQHSTRVGVLNKGRIVAAAPVAQLKQYYRMPQFDAVFSHMIAYDDAQPQ